ncbi:unnamed protein product, partial [Iphiclides podalirius]
MNEFQILLIIELAFWVTEGRVYCQDAHASPWIPLGYSCPVMCQNVINAIEKLKIMDYRKLVEGNRKRKQKVSGSYINHVINTASSENFEFGRNKRASAKDGRDYRPKFSYKNGINGKLLGDQHRMKKIKKDEEITKWKPDYAIKNVRQLDNVIGNDIDGSDAPKQDGGTSFDYEDAVYGERYENFATPHASAFQLNNTGHSEPAYYDAKKYSETVTFSKMAGSEFEMALRGAFGNGTCDWFKGKRQYVLIEKITRRCGAVDRRDGYGDEFLRTLTKTMNRFSKASFEFTEDMVELMLEKVFGKGDLIDVDKLLHYLRNAVKVHKTHRRKDTTIVLKPRHCLSLSMPGCFCRPGFVEKSGQCVQPADCFSEPSNNVYLARIVVH